MPGKSVSWDTSKDKASIKSGMVETNISTETSLKVIEKMNYDQAIANKEGLIGLLENRLSGVNAARNLMFVNTSGSGGVKGLLSRAKNAFSNPFALLNRSVSEGQVFDPNATEPDKIIPGNYDKNISAIREALAATNARLEQIAFDEKTKAEQLRIDQLRLDEERKRKDGLLSGQIKPQTDDDYYTLLVYLVNQSKELPDGDSRYDDILSTIGPHIKEMKKIANNPAYRNRLAQDAPVLYEEFKRRQNG